MFVELTKLLKKQNSYLFSYRLLYKVLIDKHKTFIFKKKTFKPFIDYSLASDQEMMKKFQSNSGLFD